ncbi:hypothetical protein OFC37_33420, partial [Escherichia coli]|nr:hypothetical protein [Escherichia coli]
RDAKPVRHWSNQLPIDIFCRVQKHVLNVVICIIAMSALRLKLDVTDPNRYMECKFNQHPPGAVD